MVALALIATIVLQPFKIWRMLSRSMNDRGSVL